MPMYEYKCPESGKVIERSIRLSDYKSVAVCTCGAMAVRFISQAPMAFVRADVHYRCPITDEPITSRQAHEANLAKHGCRLLEPGETDEVGKFRAAEEAEFDAKVEATAEEFVAGLPTEKREKLGVELDSGADVSFERI